MGSALSISALSRLSLGSVNLKVGLALVVSAVSATACTASMPLSQGSPSMLYLGGLHSLASSLRGAERFDAPMVEELTIESPVVKEAYAADTEPVVETVVAPKPVRVAQNPQEEFIFGLAEGAQEAQRVTGVPASVTIAQGILETSW